uniref:Argonaute 2 n=1 Tax=Schistocerca gregaria TaxID=7010 RepID=A0A8E5JSL9_SCHGR|nr:Argonaute 2 [Schistocerca gregaria]
MGKGKKKKTPPAQEAASSGTPPQRSQAEEAVSDRQATKKVPVKQAQEVGEASGASAVASTTHPAREQRVAERLPEALPRHPPIQEAGAAQLPQQRAPPVAYLSDQTAFPPQRGRGYSYGRGQDRGHGHSRGRARGRGGDYGHDGGDRRPFSPQQEAVQQVAAAQPGSEAPHQWQQRQQSQQQYWSQTPAPEWRGRGRGRGGGRGRGTPQPFSPTGDTFQTRGAPGARESPFAPSSAPPGLPQQQGPLPAQQMQYSGPPHQQQQRPPHEQQMQPRERPLQQQQRPPSAQQMQAEGAHRQSPRQQHPQSQKDDDISQKMKNLSLDTLNMPVRPNILEGGSKGRKTVVDTNHFRLDLSKLKNKTVMHYDVAISPDRPKRLFRSAILALQQAYFPTRHPAFDGRKNMIASSYLPHLGRGEELTATVTVMDEEKNLPKDFEIKVKLVDEVDLTCLNSYMREETNLVLPQKAIQVLDIVIRNAPAQRFTQVGRSFFTTPKEVLPLGNGMHMWLGFYQSVILGWKPFLNVDVAHKGFPADKNVSEIMAEVVGSRNATFNPDVELNRDQVADLTAFLRGLKVEYKLPDQTTSKRVYRVNSAVLSARRQEFKLADGRPITVQEYFRREKKYTLKYPNLPCLHVGAQNRATPIFLPVELCTIVKGQVTFKKMNEPQTSAMIKYAATSTVERKSKIDHSIRQADYNSDAGIKEFGISVSSQFESVNARILDAPQIIYGNEKKVQPEGGKWQAQPFLRSRSLENWVIINYRTRISTDDLWRFGEQMKDVGKKLGMAITTPQDVIPLDRRFQPYKLSGLLESLKDSGAELAVVVIDDRRADYAQVKQFAELQVGLLTQCLKWKTVSRSNYSTVQNILLKVNSKLNGVNHNLAPLIRPPCLHEPIMIIGADVTHPSPDQRNIPSVAAVCASHDPDAFKYNIQYRLQPPRTEIIQDLKEIMTKHLMFFYKETRHKPRRLIFYRDGVSEGQFAMVLREELTQIRNACRGLEESYEPPITFLVVQKRHHTRFFPKKREDEDGRNKNVPAGTIVDTSITHPRHIDFYLVSHASIQGVSRPTKYRTLWDDSNMDIDELEELTYYLCHLFSRCTRSVSYPAPTYYAHLAAFRARMYIEGQTINLDRLPHEQAQRIIKDNIIKNSPMFFV